MPVEEYVKSFRERNDTEHEVDLDRTWIDFDLVLSEAGKDQFSLPQPHIEIEFNTMQVTERKIW